MLKGARPWGAGEDVAAGPADPWGAGTGGHDAGEGRADVRWCPGGFTFFTGKVAAELGFDVHRSNVLLDDGSALTGQVAEPILDRDSKLAALHELAAQRGIKLHATLAVGDGANDLDMIRAAGLGVAFHAKPIVAKEARARVDHANLRALLFAQGYLGFGVRRRVRVDRRGPGPRQGPSALETP